jgi:exopolysaccharide production protein ExoQ
VQHYPPPRRNGASKILSWHYWISGFFLLDSMMAFHFIDRLVYGNWLGKGGDKITQGLNLLLNLASLALFSYSYRKHRRGSGGGLALGTIAFLFITSLWSTDPASTMKESIVYLFIVLGAIGLAGSLSADELMDLLSLTCLLSAVASIVLLVVSPADALMPDAPEVQGIFSHKNYLGQVMAMGALASLYRIRTGGRRRLFGLFELVVFSGMAVASTSATSCLTIVIFCCGEAIIGLCQLRGAGKALGVFAAITLMPILIVVVAYPDPILEMMGKDPTLTGRTEIWGYVIDNILRKPMLGWGYFGFWLPGNPAAMEIANKVKWFVPQAHNGLLELLLNVGVVGTSIFILLFSRTVVFAFRCLRTPRNGLAISTLMLCTGILVVGVSENVLLAPTQSSTVIFFVTTLMCEHAVRATRRQRHRMVPRMYSPRLGGSRAGEPDCTTMSRTEERTGLTYDLDWVER